MIRPDVPSPNSTDLDELAALYALGALTDDEQHQVELAMAKTTGELATDELDLDTQVAAYQCTAAALAYTSPDITPAPDLKARLFQRIQAPDSAVGESLLNLLNLSIAQLRQAAEGVDWSPIADGCMAETALWKTDDQRREFACFVRTQETCDIPLHAHATGEMLLVLEGAFTSEGRRYETGERVFFPPNSAHRPTTHKGCLVLCITSMDDRW